MCTGSQEGRWEGSKDGSVNWSINKAVGQTRLHAGSLLAATRKFTLVMGFTPGISLVMTRVSQFYGLTRLSFGSKRYDGYIYIYNTRPSLRERIGLVVGEFGTLFLQSPNYGWWLEFQLRLQTIIDHTLSQLPAFECLTGTVPSDLICS